LAEEDRRRPRAQIKTRAKKIGGTAQEAEELPEIETSGGEQSVAAVARAAL